MIAVGDEYVKRERDYKLEPFPLKGPQGVVRTPARGVLPMLGTAIEECIWKALVYYCPCRAEREGLSHGESATLSRNYSTAAWV